MDAVVFRRALGEGGGGDGDALPPWPGAWRLVPGETNQSMAHHIHTGPCGEALPRGSLRRGQDHARPNRVAKHNARSLRTET
jgi:hypothetical protein